MKITALAILFLTSISASLAAQCGSEANGAICPNNLCCSKWGYCGSTNAYCGEGCQSQCQKVGATKGVASVLSSSEFDQMLLHRDNAICPARGFYTYDAFVAAANSFPRFATTGDCCTTQKREIAAFFAQTSYYTTGGWPDAPDGPFAYGYCFFLEQGFPFDHKYSPAREVPKNSTLSFEKALSSWMTARPPKPSCHEVMSEEWRPSSDDVEAGRVPGFGLTINIMNGLEECGHGEDSRVRNRIGFYKRFCDILGISYGENLDCNSQAPFGARRPISNILMQ